MTHDDYSLILLAVVAIVGICGTVWFVNETDIQRRKYEDEAEAHLATKTRLVTTEQRTDRVLLALAPLVEKTDWMTGRWSGQFATLQSLEKKRNGAVDRVRRDLMSIPKIKELGTQMVKDQSIFKPMALY